MFKWSGCERQNFKYLLWLLVTLNLLPAKDFMGYAYWRQHPCPSDCHENVPGMVSVYLWGQVTLWENASRLTILWLGFISSFAFSALCSAFSLPSFLTSPLILSTFSSEVHGSVHPNSVKSEWLTKKPPLLLTLLMRTGWKRGKHEELATWWTNVDRPWVNRKGRAPGIWLEVRFLIHTAENSLAKPRKCSFAQHKGKTWHSFHVLSLLKPGEEPEASLSATCKFSKHFCCIHLPLSSQL